MSQYDSKNILNLKHHKKIGKIYVMPKQNIFLNLAFINFFLCLAGGRYDDVLKACGELCDLAKPIMPGTFLGHVKAKVRLVDYF